MKCSSCYMPCESSFVRLESIIYKATEEYQSHREVRWSIILCDDCAEKARISPTASAK